MTLQLRLSALLAVVSLTCGWNRIEAETPNLLPSRQSVFTVPFTVTPPRTPQEMPREVQLHVSNDRGNLWKLHEGIDPRRGQFVFRAPQDGEYWFQVQTIDHAGQTVEQKTTAPALKVLVDTVQPTLRLASRWAPSGEIEIEWEAQDANLDSNSLLIEYQVGSQGPWEPVNVDPTRIWRQDTAMRGQTSWWTNGDSTNIAVQATVADRAGNRIVSKSSLPARNQPNSAAPQTVQPETAGYQNPSGSAPIGGQNLSQVMTPNNQVSTDGSRVWAPSQTTDQPLPLNAQTVSPPSNAAPGTPNTYAAIPDSIPTKYVASTSFEMDYDVGGLSPAQLARVDLWGTADGGRTWSYFGADDDRQSPLPITVSAYGTYGFRIVLQAASGAQQAPPRPGEPPQVWVNVYPPNNPPNMTAATYQP